MSWTSFPFNSHLRVLATLSLTVLFCPRSINLASGTPTAVPGPSYWVASLVVGSTYYDKDEFRGHLHEFYSHVHEETLGRSIWGRMDSKVCYDTQGRKTPHCEVVAVNWNQEKRELRLSIEESDDRVGLIDHYECTKNDTFAVCFDHHMKSMAAKVHNHDAACHIQGRECKINNDGEFEPLPK